MNEHVLAALSAEVERTGAFLASLDDGDWHRPTRCPPWNVFELAVHVFRGAGRIADLLALGPHELEAEKSAITYFQYDTDEEAPSIVAAAKDAAAALDPAALPAAWTAAWAESLAAAAPALAVDQVYTSAYGRMHLSDYLKTRIVEVTVHAMDLRAALTMAPDPSEEGLTACCDVLRGLLGADIRPLGIDDVRFAETATGRAELDDAEREMLGPLAELFPVLA